MFVRLRVLVQWEEADSSVGSIVMSVIVWSQVNKFEIKLNRYDSLNGRVQKCQITIPTASPPF